MDKKHPFSSEEVARVFRRSFLAMIGDCVDYFNEDMPDEELVENTFKKIMLVAPDYKGIYTDEEWEEVKKYAREYIRKIIEVK